MNRIATRDLFVFGASIGSVGLVVAALLVGFHFLGWSQADHNEEKITTSDKQLPPMIRMKEEPAAEAPPPSEASGTAAYAKKKALEEMGAQRAPSAEPAGRAPETTGSAPAPEPQPEPSDNVPDRHRVQ